MSNPQRLILAGGAAVALLLVVLVVTFGFNGADAENHATADGAVKPAD